MAEPAQTPAPVAGAPAETPQADPKHPTMAVKVYAPFQIYYEGEAYSVSGLNRVGPFDILPHHHNFISILMPCKLVIEAPDGQHVVKISRALMHVKADSVVVFVDV